MWYPVTACEDWEKFGDSKRLSDTEQLKKQFKTKLENQLEVFVESCPEHRSLGSEHTTGTLCPLPPLLPHSQ